MKHQKKCDSSEAEVSVCPPVLRAVIRSKEEDRVFRQVLTEVFKPNVPPISQLIANASNVVIIVHKPGERAKRALKSLGWDGSAPVFELSSQASAALLRPYLTRGPQWMRNWLSGEWRGKFFIFSGDATILPGEQVPEDESLEDVVWSDLE